jgi:uncharacterized membrane protein
MQNPPPGPPPGQQPPGPPPQGGQPPQGYPPPGQQPGYPPQPPGYPPPGYQQPYQPPYQSAGGVDKKTGALLSYVLGWVTGVIFLFVGKDDPDVKYHAAQSIVFFGGMTVVFWVLNFLGAIIDVGAINALIWLAKIVLSVFTLVVWVMCLVRSNSYGGARFELPVVSSLVTPYAEQLANAV